MRLHPTIGGRGSRLGLSRLLAAIAAVALGVFFLQARAFAQSAPKWSEPELAGYSEVILTGRVTSVVSAEEPSSGGIYTYVTLEIDERVKGVLSGNTVTLKQLGGEVGDIGLGISGQAVFTTGEEVLVFLEQRPRDGTLYTTALWQGKWNIERDASGGATTSRRPVVSARTAEASEAAEDAIDSRLLAPFLAELRAWSRGLTRPADAAELVARPPEAPPVLDGPPTSGGGAPFTLFSPSWRWMQANTGTAVPVDIQSGGQIGLSGGGFAEIATARGLWNAVGSSLTLGNGILRTARCFSGTDSNGTISIAFMDPCGEISDSGGLLAIGGAWYTSGTQQIVNGQLFNKALRGMVINNNSSVALTFLQTPRCFQDIQTHELGHVVGLDHSAVSSAIMFPSISSACLSALSVDDESVDGAEVTGALGADDHAGLLFIYPATLTIPGVATPLSPSGTTLDTTPTYRWNPVAGATEYGITLLVKSDGPVESAILYGPQWFPASSACSGGPCEAMLTISGTTPVRTGVQYTWQIRAKNSVGAGPLSSTLTFRYVPPAPPTTPTSVSPSGTILTDTPTYQWNSVAGADSYELSVVMGSTTVVSGTYAVASVCSGSSCSVTPSDYLANGAHVWKVRGVNGVGAGAWSGDRSFTVAVAYTVWNTFFAVDTLETPFVGDFNGDGRADIITLTRQNPLAIGDVYVSLSTGTGFGASSKWHDFFAINDAEQVVIGDYDGDGKDDIATWLKESSLQVYVATSTGSGMVAAAAWLGSIGGDSGDLLFSGDADGDGKDDLILFARTTGKVTVALSSGSSFAAPTIWHNFFAVSTFERPRVGDLNGDGKADIMTFATDSPTAFGDVYVAISDGAQFGGGTSAKWHDFFAISPTEAVVVGDKNGDGKDDFFTFLPAPWGQVYTALSLGTSIGANVLYINGGMESGSERTFFTGDVNGDGKDDIIEFNQTLGIVRVTISP